MIIRWAIYETEADGGRCLSTGRVNLVAPNSAYEDAMRAGHRIELALLQMLDPDVRPLPQVTEARHTLADAARP